MVRQGAGIAGEVASQHETQRLHPGAAVQLAVEPFRLVGGVGHFPLPEGEQVLLQLLPRKAIGEAGAGAAAVQAQYQPRGFRGAAMDQRPEVQAAMVAVDACAAPFQGGAFRPPDQ
ncbi:hypothetical protein D3C84_840470 [compost metagenome]